MPDAVFLDRTPLGILVKQPKTPVVIACYQWLADCRAAGRTIYLPEIVDYEVRREFLRARLPHSIVRLDVLKQNVSYLPINTDAMLEAARLWATIRQTGLTTAADHALDGDVILAAQALTCRLPAPGLIVATGNVKHISRFIAAADWQAIVP